MSQLPPIKQEFISMTTPLEGWNPLAEDIVTNPTAPLSPSTTQSGSNQFSPPASTTNVSSPSTSQSSNVNKTYPNVTSVRETPTNAHQGLVQSFERNNNNNRPFIAARNNKSVPIGSKLQQTNSTASPFNFVSQLKQTQEQLKDVKEELVESKNAYSNLEKKYDELKLDHLELKTNIAYANKSIEELKSDNEKLHDELNQLKMNIKQGCKDRETVTQPTSDTTAINANTRTANSTIEANLQVDCYQPVINGEFDYEQEIVIHQEVDEEEEEETAQHISDSSNNEQTLQSTQITVNTEFESPPPNQYNVVDLSEVEEEDVEHYDAQCARKRELECEGVDTEQLTVKRQQISEQINDEDGAIQANANEGDDEDEENRDLDGDEELLNTTNDNNVHSLVESNEPSTSAQQQSNRIASIPPTRPNLQNLTKRKQSQPNRSVKKSKKTVVDEDGEEEEEGDNRVDDKFTVLHFNCTEPNCKAKLKSLDHLHHHLRTKHGLLPYRCFASNCNTRYDNRFQMAVHMKQHHSDQTKFGCHVCHKEFSSQRISYCHWSLHHLIGQFQCNFDECGQVLNTRRKAHSHQQCKHCPESKRFDCPRAGCSASFVTKQGLEQHENFHLGRKPFKCSFSQCNHRASQRSSLIRHIRVCHFGLPRSVKDQKAKNVMDDRDPNEYVQVVDDELIQLDIKPFSCSWPNCGFSSKKRFNLVRHVRVRHFKLPETLTEQHRLNIEDNRDANEYVQVDNQLEQGRHE